MKPITYKYPEERAPCGVGGLTAVYNRLMAYKRMASDLSDCLVSRPAPFRLVIWEPLNTKAPKPPKARPYCCYIQTVIFYHSPHIREIWPGAWRDDGGLLRKQSTGFEEWDRIEYRLANEDIVEFGGEQFVVGGGSVLWKKGRWWMVHHARRFEQREAA